MRKNIESKAQEIVSIADLAAWSNYSEMHLRELSKTGKLPPVKDGIMPFSAIQALFKYLRRDSEELVREKLLKTKADRQIAEIDAEVAAGRWKSAKEFDCILRTLGQAINSAINDREKRIEKTVLESLSEEQRATISEGIRQGARSAVDEWREDIKRALETAIEGAAKEETENDL